MNSTNFKWNILAVLAITLALFVVLSQNTLITNGVKAASGTTATTPTVAGKLASCTVLPDTANVPDLGTQVLTYTASDKDSATISGVVVTWTMSGIAGVLSTSSSTTNSSGEATTTFTGTKPGGTVTITGKGVDVTTNQTCTPTAGAVMTIAIAAATVTPSTNISIISPTPEAVPATSPAVPSGGSQSWVTPQAAVKIEAPDKSVYINIPSAAVSKGTFISLAPKSITTLAGFESARGATISYKDSAGITLASVELSKPATISFALTQAEVDRVLAGALISILRYDSPSNNWIELPSIVELAGKTALVQVTKLSDFALAIKLQAGTATATATAIPVPPTATAVPPATGDFTPSSGLLIMLTMVGLLLVVGSGYYLRFSKS
jgi:hypothetical protein